MGEENTKDAGLASVVANAARWSMLAQVASKLISPITTMILARILTPEAFGVMALSSMVISLSAMFSDAGFQRYIVQEKFCSKIEESHYASVAFWTNLAISIVIVVLIAAFQEPLAIFVGCPGLGSMLVVSSFSLPLTALSGVQTALYQKKMDFRTLFGSRVGSSLLIFLVSVPMAIFGCDYWSLVVGTLASNILLAIWLTALSDWKPLAFYDFSMLSHMLSFGIWILLESFATWLNTWLGTFIVARLMSEVYVGYYNTSVNMASSITGVITAAILPVAFSTFAKVKSDRRRFEHIFFTMQRYLAICIVPIAVGCFVFRELITTVLLGAQWIESALFFGCWMLAGCAVIVYGNLCSEAYRAFGVPRYCVLVQVAYLVPFVPALYLGANLGFEVFSVVVPTGRLALCFIHMVVVKMALGVSPSKMVLGPKWTYAQTAIAMLPGIIVTSMHPSIGMQMVAALLSMVIYITLVFLVKDTRVSVLDLVGRLKKTS